MAAATAYGTQGCLSSGETPFNMLFGRGVGSFPTLLNQAGHNIFLSVSVETGLVGISLFLAVLAMVFAERRRLVRSDRLMWSAVCGVWLVGVVALSWEFQKTTWVLMGLVAGFAAAAQRASQHRPADHGVATSSLANEYAK